MPSNASYSLDTPFRITLPDSAARVLGLSDTRFNTNPENTKRDLSFLDSLFRTLNTLLTHRLR
jgi:glycerol-3-phosphate dehydrogenase